MSMRQFATEDPVRHLAWQVLVGVKVAEPLDKQRAALVYMRELIDRRLQELGEEMGHVERAEKAISSLPPPSPSPTGEQEGHLPLAAKATVQVPPASPASLDDEGHCPRADNGHMTDAPSSTPNKAGEGQRANAQKSHWTDAPPALAPTATQRAAAARSMAVAAAATAKTVLDTLMVRGSIAIGDVRYVGLEVIQTANEWEAAFIQEIRNCGIPPDQSLRVRDYLTAKQVETCRRAADRRFHNVA
jgi:hypothetical protein